MLFVFSAAEGITFPIQGNDDLLSMNDVELTILQMQTYLARVS